MSYLKYSIQIATIATKFLNKSQTMLNCINRLNHTCTQIALFFISSPRCLCWWEMLKLFFFLVFFFYHYICLISIIIVAPNGIWSKLELRNGFDIKLIKSIQDTERIIGNYSINRCWMWYLIYIPILLSSDFCILHVFGLEWKLSFLLHVLLDIQFDTQWLLPS